MTTWDDQNLELTHVTSVHVVGEVEAVAGGRVETEVDVKSCFRVRRHHGRLDEAVTQ